MTLHLLSDGRKMKGSVARTSPVKHRNPFVMDDVIIVGGRIKLSCMVYGITEDIWLIKIFILNVNNFTVLLDIFFLLNF